MARIVKKGRVSCWLSESVAMKRAYNVSVIQYANPTKPSRSLMFYDEETDSPTKTSCKMYEVASLVDIDFDDECVKFRTKSGAWGKFYTNSSEEADSWHDSIKYGLADLAVNDLPPSEDVDAINLCSNDPTYLTFKDTNGGQEHLKELKSSDLAVSSMEAGSSTTNGSSKEEDAYVDMNGGYAPGNLSPDAAKPGKVSLVTDTSSSSDSSKGEGAYVDTTRNRPEAGESMTVECKVNTDLFVQPGGNGANHLVILNDQEVKIIQAFREQRLIYSYRPI